MDQPSRLRIGVIISDPVRADGFFALFSCFAELETMQPTEAVRRQDISMIVLDSEEAIFPLLAAFRRSRAGLRILAFGSINDPTYISHVIRAGAKGYLTHNASAAEIQTAIQVVADGSIWAPRKVLSGLIDTLAPQEIAPLPVRFTPRERELLQHLVQGCPDRTIAGAMGLSVRTVQAMVRELFRRVGVDNRVALSVYVLEKHILTA